MSAPVPSERQMTIRPTGGVELWRAPLLDLAQCYAVHDLTELVEGRHSAGYDTSEATRAGGATAGTRSAESPLHRRAPHEVTEDAPHIDKIGNSSWPYIPGRFSRWQ